MNSSISQSVTLTGGSTFKVDLYAAQRAVVNPTFQVVRVRLTPAAVVTSTKQFVWVGNRIAEERDASNNVLRRFYPQGEQISGTSYYYTRDHLGSVRELTDSTNAIRAQYDYDAWGNRTKLSGDLDSEFGYTNFYYHNPSSLSLALYRTYNSSWGRWLSRDPAAEKAGVNLYRYVSNDPIDNVDPVGLSWLDAISHFDLYGVLNNAAADAYGYGGFWGNAGGIAANLGTTLLDLLGGEAVLDAATRSGSAAGCGDTGGAWLNGAEAGILIAIAAIPGIGEETAAVRMTADQVALKELVEETSLQGTRALSSTDARAVVEWAQETKYPGFRAGPGDLANPSNWNANPVPHIHLPGAGKTGGHIPVQWP